MTKNVILPGHLSVLQRTLVFTTCEKLQLTNQYWAAAAATAAVADDDDDDLD